LALEAATVACVVHAASEYDVSLKVPDAQLTVT